MAITATHTYKQEEIEAEVIDGADIDCQVLSRVNDNKINSAVITFTTTTFTDPISVPCDTFLDSSLSVSGYICTMDAAPTFTAHYTLISEGLYGVVLTPAQLTALFDVVA